MTRPFHVAALILLLLSSVFAAADGKISKETFESRGKKRTYYLFVPKSTDGQTSVPLVVLLHGSNRNGLSLVEKWKDLAEKERFIIVGPDSSEPSTWRVTEDGPEFLRGLIETLWSKYPIDHRRVYLFGHSGGAVFAIDLSMMESEYFAATAIHAGSWRSAEEFAALQYATRKTPLAIFVGDRDPFFPLNWVKATADALKARGFPVETTIMKGHDHWYYDLASQINGNAWEFLKRHELTQEPRYTTYSFSGGGTGGAAELNVALHELNALRIKFNETLQLFNAREPELAMRVGNREATERLAREQIAALREGLATRRASFEIEEKLAKQKLSGNYPQYFSVLAQVDQKRIEIIEAMLERAQLRLGTEALEVTNTKLNEAAVKIERLNQEAAELEQKAERIRAGQK